MTGFWPWWLGALAFGALTPAVFVATGRMLGVSGYWARLVSRRDQRRVADAWVQSQDQERMERALLAATIAEFGEQAMAELLPQAETKDAAPATPPPLTWSANATFLVCLAVGGGLAALLRDGFSVTTASSPAMHDVFGAATPFVLVGGGFLVGVGTRMAGGCTSGHGLSGCASLQPGSLVATALFFVAGVAMSFAVVAL